MSVAVSGTLRWDDVDVSEAWHDGTVVLCVRSDSRSAACESTVWAGVCVCIVGQALDSATTSQCVSWRSNDSMGCVWCLAADVVQRLYQLHASSVSHLHRLCRHDLCWLCARFVVGCDVHRLVIARGLCTRFAAHDRFGIDQWSQHCLQQYFCVCSSNKNFTVLF